MEIDLSVVIPVYNASKYLDRCIDSVLKQSYDNFELLLIDDCSKDDSYFICKKYAEQDKRVKVYQNSHNSGVSATRNSGIQKATGEYICFIDSDDYILPDMFSTMINELKSKDYDFCVCQFATLYSTGEIREYPQYFNKYLDEYNSIDFNRLMIHCRNFYDDGVVCSQWNKIYKREIFNQIRFEGRYAEDYRIADLINSNSYRVRVLKKTYYVYAYQNTDSLTHQAFNPARFEFLDVLEKRVSLYSADKKDVIATMTKYCDTFLEYYEKAIDSNIEVPVKYYGCYKDFSRRLKGLVKKKNYLRYSLFRIHPKFYLAAIKIRNKVKGNRH